MRIQSLYQNKNFSDMFDNILNKYEAQSVTKKESYSIPVDTFNKVKEKTAKAKVADKDIPIVTMQDAYRKIAELSNEYPENSAIKSIAFHLKCKYENNPQGYFTLGQVEDLKKYADKLLPKKLFAKSSNVVCDAIDSMIKSSIKNRFDIKKLDKIASEITIQNQFDVAIETNGLSLDRPDMQEIREYIAYKVNMKLTANFTSDYKKIGTEVGLLPITLDTYVKYMTGRWPEGVSEDYALEWANRFKRGVEYQSSDLAGQSILKRINTDSFKSSSRVARTASTLNGGQYSEDILKKALNEDWKTIESEKKEHKAQFEGIMSESNGTKGKMSLEAALEQSDVVKQFNPKKSNTYLVRKDVFGSFNLYSSKGSQDAILLDKYASLEALKEDVSSLPDMWMV